MGRISAKENKNDNFTLIPVRTVPTPLLQGFRVFSGNFAAAKSIPLQICLNITLAFG